jgi:tripartite-type tricarboxylate transporter receptor subunit TctC
VPYQPAQAIGAAVAGHTQVSSTSMPPAVPQVKAGKLRALAVTSAQRSAALPDVPTMREVGYPDFDLIGWFGLWLPPNTRQEIVARLHAEVERAIADPDIRNRFDELGLLPGGMRTDEFARYVAQDLAQMRDLAARIAKAGGNKTE